MKKWISHTLILVTMILLVFLLTWEASAKTIYVTTKTIQETIYKAASGDTIIINNSYTEAIVVDRPLTIISEKKPHYRPREIKSFMFRQAM